MRSIHILYWLMLCFNLTFAQTNLYPDTGKVGFGTLTPRAKLEVADWIASLNISSNKHTEAMNDNEVIGSINFFKHYALAKAASIKLLQAGNGDHYSQGHLAFYTNSEENPYTCIPQERMRITSIGDVCIGTNDSKGYRLAVNGKIRAQEIKVETSPWPDYVFTKSYQLPTLQETEKHIKEKGHLPGIPSAAEVKAHGVDLGEMNAKLLQKIEELTLHLINKDKEIKNLNGHVQQQDVKINLILNKLNDLH